VKPCLPILKELFRELSLFVTNFLCSLLECGQLREKDEGRIRLEGSAHLNVGMCTKTSASSCLVHVAEIYHVSRGLDI
jgi:hypothetical protein